MPIAKRFMFAVSLVLVLAAAVPLACAQSFVMSLPRPSQRAVAGQRVGLTDITVNYHRPLVGGRKIWGALVPYDQVWRAGANENTTIAFSDPVSIEGQPLAKGVYGLHMIPNENEWTIIFSKNSTSWGSFTYDQKEDALRVKVKPQAAEMHEALSYDFDDVKPDATLVTLRWEKVAVPFRVSVDPNTTVQNVRAQFRDLPQYTWESWNDAAQYCATGKMNLDEALKWTDRSIQMEERFENVNTKMNVLEALNRPTEAAAARARSLEIANAQQLYFYGRALQQQKKDNEAMDVFRATAKRFPNHWLAHMANARVSSAAGDFPAAIKELKAAEPGANNPQQKQNLENLLHRLEAKQDINR